MSEFVQFVATHQQELYRETIQHLWLTLISLLLAVVTGVATGIVLTRVLRLSRPVLGFVSVIQTIPSLALLGFMLPLFGIGAVPSIIMLFLYALLPIVRNTFAGIMDVPPPVKEAALGMGLSNWQILWKVELPLAVPVIFAGIRTATVINVGIATLCALIASGGLGTFIYRGISLNNSTMIMAGALPAAFMALFFDLLLGWLQQRITKIFKWFIAGLILFVAGLLAYQLWLSGGSGPARFRAGFDPEFMERDDGYPGLSETYGLQMESVELNAGLMYQAIREGKVDVIGGYSSDGRIEAYGLKVLDDDKHYFPPYYAAPVINAQSLKDYPALGGILGKLAGEIPDSTMRRLNYLVDGRKLSPEAVARSYLKEKGFNTEIDRVGEAEIVIGGKNFTEQFILAEIFAALIENYSNLTVETKAGLGGTKICFDALVNQEIDIYPEYTGTGLQVLLHPPQDTLNAIIREPEQVFEYVKRQSAAQFGMVWLEPLGFNNSYTLMMRQDRADSLGIESISDLAQYLEEGEIAGGLE